MAQPVMPQPEVAYEDGSPGAQTIKRLAAGQENLSHFLYAIRQKASNPMKPKTRRILQTSLFVRHPGFCCHFAPCLCPSAMGSQW